MSYMEPVIGQKRQHERVPLRMTASLRESGGRKYDIIVFDLSLSGCRCEALFTVNPGSRIWIQIPGMQSIETVVIRRDRFILGCQFVNKLHPATFDHIRTKF